MEANPSPRRLVLAVCRRLCCNVRGLAGNLNNLTVASSQYDILLCSETLVSDGSGVAGFRIWSPCLNCSARARPLGPEGWLHMYEMVTEHFANSNLRVIVVKCWVFGARYNLYVFSLYGNPALMTAFFIVSNINICRLC